MKYTSQQFCDTTIDLVGSYRLSRIRPWGRPWLWRTTNSKLFPWVQCKSTPMAI